MDKVIRISCQQLGDEFNRRDLINAAQGRESRLLELGRLEFDRQLSLANDYPRTVENLEQRIAACERELGLS